MLDERRLKELASIIQGLQSTKQKAKSSKRGRDWESHAEPSALKSDQPLRVLAEAGMIIRDPSVFHLIIHQVYTSEPLLHHQAGLHTRETRSISAQEAAL